MTELTHKLIENAKKIFNLLNPIEQLKNRALFDSLWKNYIEDKNLSTEVDVVQ